MTQTMLTNTLTIIGILGVAVLQHFGFIDQTVATIVYSALPAYAVGSGTLRVTPGAPVTSPKVVVTQGSSVQAVQPSNRG